MYLSYRVQKYLLILLIFPLCFLSTYRLYAENPNAFSREITKTDPTVIEVDGEFAQRTLDFMFPGDINFGELITDIEVSLTFDTEFASDVFYILTSPSGTQITLIEGLQNEGGTNRGPTYSGISTSPVTVNFLQSACQSVGGEPKSGTFRPVESLQSLIGENPTGTWTLTIGDSKALGDSLFHESFSIRLSLGALCTLEATAVIDQQVSCAENLDGILDVDIQGGVGPYTYQWCHGPTTDSLSGLGAGTYTVAVTDFLGCTSTSSVKLQDPDSLGVVITIIDSISCKGFSDAIIEASPIGGTGPYTYEWSTGADSSRLENLPIGTYRVTLTDAQGCQGVAEENLSEPDSLLLDISLLTEPSCQTSADGILEGTASGGSPPYSYSWSHGAETARAESLLKDTYRLTLTDRNGCEQVDSLILESNDPISPIALCQDQTVYLNEQGWVLISPEMLDDGSSDFCGIASYEVDMDSFSCSELGKNSVTLTVTDSSGNFQTCTSSVTVIDSIAPVITSCPSDIQIPTSTGECQALVTWVAPTGSDNCSSVSLTASHLPGTTFPIGATTVTYTAEDASGNKSTCSFLVSVVDTEKPNIACRDISLYLDASGQANLAVEDLDAGSSDNCELVSLSLSRTAFSCNEAGIQTVWLVGEDASGNKDSCSAQVTVRDTLAPILTCKNMSVYLDAAGQVSLSPQDLVESVSDPCGIASLSVSQTNFSCEDMGTQSVVLTAVDAQGNVGTCQAQVSIQDTIAPVVLCRNIIRYLDETGQVILNPSDVDEGSTDNCEVSTLALSQTTFTCENLGENEITLTATDAAGNQGTCQATLSLRDTLAPLALCRDTTLYLQEEGTVAIEANDLGRGSSDNCIISSMRLSKTSFSVEDLGENTVELTVEDQTGNTASCSARIVIADTLSLEVTCKDTLAFLAEDGLLLPDALLLVDTLKNAFYPYEFTVDRDTLSCDNLGENVLVLTVSDTLGRSANCMSSLSLQDTLAPEALCRNTTLYLDSTGMAILTISDVDAGSLDNCSSISLNIDKSVFTCEDVGTHTVELSVRDLAGNTQTCQSIVQVEDRIAPTVVGIDTTLILDEAGFASLPLDSTLLQLIEDPCGISTVFTSQTNFSCEDLGSNAVIITVFDLHGNIGTDTVEVFVQDTLAPQISCQAIERYLPPDTSLVLDPQQVIVGTDDICGVDSLWLSQNTFGCEETGLRELIVYAKDPAGNIGQCISELSLIDTISQAFVCLQDTVIDNDPGNCGAVYSFPFLDLCPNSTVTQVSGLPSGSLFPIGPTMNTFLISQDSGRVDTCRFTVTVHQTGEPLVIFPIPPRFSFFEAGYVRKILSWIEEIQIIYPCDSIPEDSAENRANLILTALEDQKETLGAYYDVIVKELTRQNSSELRLHVAPNPVKEGFIELSLEGGEAGFISLKLIDIHGKEIRSERILINPSKRVDVSGLARGVYLLEVKLPNGEQVVRKIQVE